jgi:hypothetical protein
LSQYCEDILKTNSGSTAIFNSDTQKFTRIFISFGAGAFGLAYCQPITSNGLDGTHLKHKYRGILLAATAVDGMAVAHAIVDQENDENWLWFLQILHCIIPAPNLMNTEAYWTK